MSLNQKHDEQRRMTSITRKLHWFMLRGKIGRSIGSDLLLLLCLTVGWCAQQEYTAFGMILLENHRRFDLVETAADPGMDLIYRVTSQAGGPVLAVSCLIPFTVIGILVVSLLILQALGLIFSYYREDGRIRKILAPINEIALQADELSRLSFNEDKYQQIEEALEHIRPDQAEAEGPLSFGDADLTGVEAAMNNLLLRMRDTLRQQSRFKILEEGITAIRNEADHMNYLVEQLLFLARGDSGRTSLNRQQVRTDELMTEIYEESLMIDEKHRYRLSNSGLWEEVLIDPGLMKQAVRILVDNAAKYTPEGEEIQLSYGINEKGSPYLQVQDLGQGISESELPHIFERFFRADEARGSAGTGLGLSIAKWIVDKHEGHFEVLSVRDLGTRIRIVL